MKDHSMIILLEDEIPSIDGHSLKSRHDYGTFEWKKSWLSDEIGLILIWQNGLITISD